MSVANERRGASGSVGGAFDDRPLFWALVALPSARERPEEINYLMENPLVFISIILT